MAIIILGKSPCALCGEILRASDDVVALPAFSYGKADPLWVFNDAGLHNRCLAADPRRSLVEEVVEELHARAGPGHRICVVCEEEVAHYAEHVMIPRLAHDEKHPLHRYRYTHLHRACVRQWGDVDHALDLLRKADQDGIAGLETLIETLEDHGSDVD